MENYICINGKKAELTEEQMKALGIKIPNESPFKRAPEGKSFYCITNKNTVEFGFEIHDFYCGQLHKVANYCTDKAILEQRALHETLNRLLWRYSMEHKANAKEQTVNGICIKHSNEGWIVFHMGFTHNIPGLTYFDNERIARNAIKEIVEPFMKEHPEFKW